MVFAGKTGKSEGVSLPFFPCLAQEHFRSLTWHKIDVFRFFCYYLKDVMGDMLDQFDFNMLCLHGPKFLYVVISFQVLLLSLYFKDFPDHLIGKTPFVVIPGHNLDRKSVV